MEAGRETDGQEQEHCSERETGNGGPYIYDVTVSEIIFFLSIALRSFTLSSDEEGEPVRAL